MRPKFEVGEEVILQSKICPKYNGEYFVEGVLITGTKGVIDRVSGKKYDCIFTRHPVGYLLSNKIFNEDIGYEVVWAESALRKKHKPSRMSFGDLMSSLKSPVNS